MEYPDEPKMASFAEAADAQTSKIRQEISGRQAELSERLASLKAQVADAEKALGMWQAMDNSRTANTMRATAKEGF